MMTEKERQSWLEETAERKADFEDMARKAPPRPPMTPQEYITFLTNYHRAFGHMMKPRPPIQGTKFLL